VFIDSHCHLDRIDLTPYDGCMDAALAAAHDAGVKALLCVCVDLENFPAVLELAKSKKNVWASVGVHPLEPHEKPLDAETLRSLARDDRVVAIGETGLDYYRGGGQTGPMQDSFVSHLEVARDLGLPVIVHSRSARQDTLDLLRAHACQEKAGVLHCFTEDWNMARVALDLGFYISFSGVVTFKNAGELREVAKKVPLDRMLIETDAPWLAPVPYRGKSNEPRFVVEVARLLAELRGMEMEEVGRVTSENFFRLFGNAVLT